MPEDTKDWSPKDYYRFYNGRYFRGRLPDIPVEWSAKAFRKGDPNAGCLGVAWFESGVPLGIQLNVKYKEASAIWLRVLLHEMTHVEQASLPKAQAHGRKFNKRMKQLAAIGAFNGLW
jgi:hypothetical protein